jgi:hypothetical protein
MRKTTLAGFGFATLVFAASASADVAGVGPFVGIWYSHEEQVVIDPDGKGHLRYPDFSLCPRCSMADVPASTADFALTSVSNGVASGQVTAATNAQVHPAGEAVTATLTAGSPGQILQLTIGGKLERGGFCNSTSVGQCGA